MFRSVPHILGLFFAGYLEKPLLRSSLVEPDGLAELRDSLDSTTPLAKNLMYTHLANGVWLQKAYAAINRANDRITC